MTNLRRMTLAFVLAGGVISAFVKFATGSFIPEENYVVDFSKLPKEIGQFSNQTERNTDGALELRAVQCERSIFVNAYSIKESWPEALPALLYPSNEWRILYVYRGRTYDSFARIPAYLRLVASRSMEALTMSRRDSSDGIVFAFHIPVECSISSHSAIAAAEIALGLAVPEPRY